MFFFDYEENPNSQSNPKPRPTSPSPKVNVNAGMEFVYEKTKKGIKSTTLAVLFDLRECRY